jgi:putative Mn2+ efflux pump MntP
VEKEVPNKVISPPEVSLFESFPFVNGVGVGVGVGVSVDVGVGVGPKSQIGYEVPVKVTVVGVTPVMNMVAVAVGSHTNTLFAVSADCVGDVIVKLN